MSYHLGDFALETTVYAKFTTVTTTGAPTQLAGSPVVSVYENDDNTQITAGVTLNVDEDGVTGLNQLVIAATAANGYEAAKFYTAVITTGTVGGTSVVGYCVASFTIQAVSALRPTTAGRTLDVSATGEGGVDWANVGSPTTANNLSATTVNLTNTVTTYTGNTVQTGDSFARIGANGAGLTAIDLPNQTMNITGDITGNLSGTVGSVTGAVGSVTGNVGGNVTGTVGSVVGAVGSVTGSVGGNVTGTVGSVVGAVGSVAANGITAASIATGAVDADALAADAITAIWAKALAELAQATPSATPSVLNAIALLYMMARNAVTVTDTTKSFTNDAGTVIITKALSDDGTTYTEAEMVSGP